MLTSLVCCSKKPEGKLNGLSKWDVDVINTVPEKRAFEEDTFLIGGYRMNGEVYEKVNKIVNDVLKRNGKKYSSPFEKTLGAIPICKELDKNKDYKITLKEIQCQGSDQNSTL